MKSLSQLYLDIFGIQVLVEVNDLDLLARIKKDFSHFESSKKFTYEFHFIAHLGGIPWRKLPELKSSKQSINSITYDQKNIRFNDYYKEALSIYDYDKEYCEVYSHDLNRLHEILYLVILSRTGKKMDELGLHKIHACSLKYKQKTLVLMLPMKGGKSTLFFNLIKNPEIEILSDDTPIVDQEGHIRAYPLRVGIEDDSKFKNLYDESQAYSIERKQYGLKKLIPMEAFKNKIAQGFSGEVILINGIRCSNKECELVRCSSLKMFSFLKTHMIVGVGLPMIIEYFIRANFYDWLKNLKIFIARVRAALKLSFRSQNYICYMGEDPELNARTIERLLVE